MLISAFLTTLSSFEASADCLCRANGAEYEQGQLACLSLPEGPRLARCEKVLNNSSWKVLREGCLQTTRLSDESREIAAAALPAARSTSHP